MNTLQYRQLARARVVKALFPTASETQLVPGLLEALEEFVTHLDVIEVLASRQAQRPDVIMENRGEAIAAMEEAALSVAGRVASYAHRVGLNTLELDVRINARELRRTRLEDRVRVCQHVCDVVASVIDTIADSGVTAAELAQLQEKVAAARAVLPALRSLVVDKSNATVQLAAEFAALNETLRRQIEPVMAPLQTRNPALYAKFRAACRVIDLGGSHGNDSPAATLATAAATSASAAVTTTHVTPAAAAATVPLAA